MPVTPEALARALAARPAVRHPALPGRRNHLPAGVLVPLRRQDDRLQVIVTLRPQTLRRHGGEVSFPGGRPEAGDADLLATATRETREELGLTDIRILGRLASMPVYTSDFRLEPFVGLVAEGHPIRPDPNEVEEALLLDLDSIFEAGHVEAFDAHHDGMVVRMPVFRPGGHVMYGATAMTLWELLGVIADVAGRPVPELVLGDLTLNDVLTKMARAGDAAAARTRAARG